MDNTFMKRMIEISGFNPVGNIYKLYPDYLDFFK
ncbi:unnamed protein product, partial [marine sediment metagenome]